jgi:hypothetical protein
MRTIIYHLSLLFRYAQKKADEMKAVSLQSALDTVETLEVKLTEFAQRHKAEIQHDPVFRQRYVPYNCLYIFDCVQSIVLLVGIQE